MLRQLVMACVRRLRMVVALDGLTDDMRIRRMARMLLVPAGLFKAAWLYCGSRALARRDSVEYGMAIVAIVKDEKPYISEWIEYHSLLGVEHFYIYDNGSTDGTLGALRQFERDGRVTALRMGGRYRHLDAYNDTLNRFGDKCRYMAFIDVDEFLYSADGGSLESLCDRLIGDRGGLALNWSVFGSSGYGRSPGGLVTQTYLWRSDDTFEANRHIKTICDPIRVAGFISSHFCEYLPGFCSHSVGGHTQYGPFCEEGPSHVLRLNHYFTKSREEFLSKRMRGLSDGPGVRDLDDFERHDRNDVYDDGMLTFGNELERAMGLGSNVS